MISSHEKGRDPMVAGTPAPATVENIQALRGIAALLVLWAHLTFPLRVLCPSFALSPLVNTAYGGSGVDLFFIISGYVISLTACKRHHRPLDFFLARIARISPIYLVVTVLAFLGKDLFLWSHLPLRSIWNGLFYLPIFDWRDYTEPPLAVGWSLSFEMWFYVVFALLLLRWKPRKVALILPILFAIGAPLMTLYQGAWYFPRFMFHPFVMEFAFGCMVYLTQQWVPGRLSWVLLAGGILYLLIFSRHAGFLGFHIGLLSLEIGHAWLRVALWGVPAAFIVAGLVGLERHYGYILPRFLVWLGGISYSLYLTHRFSMMLVEKAGLWVGLRSPLVAVPVLVITCVVLGWICWRWVEKPLTSQAQKWAKTKARPARPAVGDRTGLKPAGDAS
jgi:exopolysaccharide production protein ExoZ